jgi:hypothetical protein
MAQLVFSPVSRASFAAGYVLAISRDFPSFKMALLSLLFICADHCESIRRRKDGRLNDTSLTATGDKKHH